MAFRKKSTEKRGWGLRAHRKRWAKRRRRQADREETARALGDLTSVDQLLGAYDEGWLDPSDALADERSDGDSAADDCDHFWLRAAPSRIGKEICARCGAQRPAPPACADVKRFLAEHQDLSALLPDLVVAVTSYLGEADVALSLSADDADDAELIVSFRTPLSANESSERMRRFYAECWNELLTPYSHLVSIAVEPRYAEAACCGREHPLSRNDERSVVHDRRHILRLAAELIRTGLLDVITPEELAELRRPRIAVGTDDGPDLVAAEEEMEKLVHYFEETEDQLTAQSDAPVHLVETQSARRVLFAISGFLDDEAERNRAWKHADPSEVAQAFIDLVAAFVKQRKLSWEELAKELHLEREGFRRLADLASEDG